MGGVSGQVTLRGRVVDGSSGEPIFAANVLVQGTQTGVTTDFDGQFRLVVVLGLLTFASVTLCQYVGCCGAVGSLTYLVGRILATGGLYCAAHLLL